MELIYHQLNLVELHRLKPAERYDGTRYVYMNVLTGLAFLPKQIFEGYISKYEKGD